MSDARLPAHLEVAGLIRLTQAEGGFAAVLHRGEREAGTLLVVIAGNRGESKAYERMPLPDGTRDWQCAKAQNPENPRDFDEYLTRRGGQDPDLWIIELDVPDGERFIGLTG